MFATNVWLGDLGNWGFGEYLSVSFFFVCHIREMCSWERFCTLAREPEQRKVGIEVHVTLANLGKITVAGNIESKTTTLTDFRGNSDITTMKLS